MASTTTQSPFNTTPKEHNNAPGYPQDTLELNERDFERRISWDDQGAARTERTTAPSNGLKAGSMIFDATTTLGSKLPKKGIELTFGAAKGAADLMFSDDGVKGAVEGIFSMLTAQEETPEQRQAKQQEAVKKAELSAQHQQNVKFADALRPAGITELPNKKMVKAAGQAMTLQQVVDTLRESGSSHLLDNKGELTTYATSEIDKAIARTEAMRLRNEKQAKMQAVKPKSEGVDINMQANGRYESANNVQNKKG